MDVSDTNLLLSETSVASMCAGFSSNMLWLDIEFTDLHKPERGRILEIGARITTNSMRFIPNAVCHAVIRQENLKAEDLNHFCREHFSAPRPADMNASLIELCNRSEIDLKDAEALLVDLVDVYRGNQQIQLCGATIRKDLQYIELYMPALFQRIHYQLRDVTSQLSDALREFPAIRSFLPTRRRSHCAMDDVDETLRLSRWLSAITKRDFLQLPTGQILMRDGPTIDEIMTVDVLAHKRPPASLRLNKTAKDPTGLRPFSSSNVKSAPPIIFPMPPGTQKQEEVAAAAATPAAAAATPASATSTSAAATPASATSASATSASATSASASASASATPTPVAPRGASTKAVAFQSPRVSQFGGSSGSGSWRKWPPRMAAAATSTYPKPR